MMRFNQVCFMGLGLLLAGCASAPQGYMADTEMLSKRREAGAYTPTTEADMNAIVADRSHAGTPLNLKGFDMTFHDEFNQMSVTGEDGNGPWYSPVHDSFGAGIFRGPSADPEQGPVFVKDGKLVIKLYKEATGTDGKKGRWVSSLVQSVNKDGHGFAQQYGYFEMRAKMAEGIPTWGGIWLHSHPALTGPNMPQVEIDTVEAYGGDPKGLHSAIHLWPAKPPLPGDITKKGTKGSYNVVKGMFEGFHTYGTLVTPEQIIFYYDRKELVRMATKPEFKTPLYVLVDLALLPKLYGYAKGEMQMDVDYVRVFQKEGGWTVPPASPAR